MERIKRQQTDTIHGYNNNKKQKLQNKIITIDINKSRLEDLANEILYEIFEYLDIYHVYEGFINLNKRFKNLFINSNLPIQINISTMSKSNFERYHKNIILPNKHRINILRLSNPFTVDIIFSPPRFILKFISLETLILDNISAKYLSDILTYSMFLPKLRSLVLNLADYVQYSTTLFSSIFLISKLKYCKITYQTKIYRQPSDIFFDKDERSSIEHLVINTGFLFESFGDLLNCLPKLRHLSIDYLIQSFYTEKELCPAVVKNLKYVSLKLEDIPFNKLEELIKYFFRRVEVLRLTTRYDKAYLDAKRWEQLIKSYMPNLRIFDINHHDSVLDNNPLTYHDLINQFNSSFWIEKQWFFTHQHDWQERFDSGIFYSTNPYRRKNFEFYWQMDKHMCPYIQRTNLNSVKHVFIASKKPTNNCLNYFPNATELTIDYYFKISDDLISRILNRIVPLKQLTKLIIKCYDFTFEQIVSLLRFTPNLHTLKLGLLSMHKTNLKLMKQNENFQYVSNRNKIKNLEMRTSCTLEQIPLIVTLFPKLEYLKTGMNRKEIGEITRYLLSKNNIETRHLYFLCISEIAKICLKELNMLIKTENLLDVYFIKFVNRDLYIWW